MDSDCDHIYDEHGLCFECDKPRIVVLPSLPS